MGSTDPIVSNPRVRQAPVGAGLGRNTGRWPRSTHRSRKPEFLNANGGSPDSVTQTPRSKPVHRNGSRSTSQTDNTRTSANRDPNQHPLGSARNPGNKVELKINGRHRKKLANRSRYDPSFLQSHFIRSRTTWFSMYAPQIGTRPAKRRDDNSLARLKSYSPLKYSIQQRSKTSIMQVRSRSDSLQNQVNGFIRSSIGSWRGLLSRLLTGTQARPAGKPVVG